MKRLPFTLGLILTLCLCSAICRGGDPQPKHSWLNKLVPCGCPPPIGCCPDDYCRKPLPCLPCLMGCRLCDDYCRKPLPCLPCLPGCRLCDDYCRKPLPNFCWPVSCNLTCVPTCGYSVPCQAPKADYSLAPPAAPGGGGPQLGEIQSP